jgi:hypothetical protein
VINQLLNACADVMKTAKNHSNVDYHSYGSGWVEVRIWTFSMTSFLMFLSSGFMRILEIRRPTKVKSSSLKPLVVMVGVPSLNPEV